MTVALVDDQHLGAVLRGATARRLDQVDLYTTGHWYVRLCQAVMATKPLRGALSRPFGDLPDDLQDRAVGAVLELPSEIGLVSLRDLAPTIARLRDHHSLNILGMEALAASVILGAEVHLSGPSPRLEESLANEGVRSHVWRPER